MVSEDLSVKVRILAATLDANASALTEESYELLIEKYSELFENKGVRLEEAQE